MRLILYISKASNIRKRGGIPLDLVQIVHTSRTMNRIHGICGFLSYRNGYYLQAIEGDPDKVWNLFKNIKQDKRHSAIHTILDVAEDVPIFNNWRMRTTTEVRCNTDTTTLLRKNFKKISRQSMEGKKLLEEFYGANTLDNMSSESQLVAPIDFRKYKVELLEWPNFIAIRPSYPVLELCAVLSTGFCSVSKLQNDERFSNYKQLHLILDQLYSAGILTLRPDKYAVGTPDKSDRISYSAGPHPDRFARELEKKGFIERMKLFFQRL